MVELTLIFSGVFLVQMILYEVHLGMLAFFRTRFFGEALEPYKILRNIFDLVFIVFVWILAIAYYAKIARDLGCSDSFAMVPFFLFGGYAIWRHKNSKDPTRKPRKRLKIARAEIHASFWQTPRVYLKEMWQEQKERDPFIRVFWDVSQPVQILWVVYGLNYLWMFIELISLVVQSKFIFWGTIVQKDGVEELDLYPIPFFISVSIFVVGTLMYFYQFVRALKKIREKYGVNGEKIPS